MRLRLLNSLAKRVEEVVPGNPDGILRMYHCGPTVYGPPHLGNLRRFLVADLLVRGARFLGYRVRSVMNITDVGHLLDSAPLAAGELPTPLSQLRQGSAGQAEFRGTSRGAGPTPLAQSHAGQDRILVAAQREGLSPEQIAAKYTAEFFAALAALRAEPADYYPRATMHIPQMQELIRQLLAKGLAYETCSGVYFDVTRFPGYGKLSGNTLDAIQAGARVAPLEEKRHPADFALWVGAPREHRMQWDSPWGRGYPGWHIECSAMSMQLLGQSIDIHSGGADNRFPHHENEIAQSEGATGAPFVRIWVHNEFLVLKGEKMAKSEGETLTLPDVTDRGYDPLAFRLLCLQTHYRSPLTFSWENMDAASEALKTLRAFVRRLGEARSTSEEARADATLGDRLAKLEHCFTEAIADDLGSPQALAALFVFQRETNPALQSGTVTPTDADAVRATLRKLDRVLALLDVDAPPRADQVPDDVRRLVEQREEARRRQDFASADRLRAEIQFLGYRLEDAPTGPRITKAPS